MAALPIVQETAYPCFRKRTRAKDLVEFYTLTQEELSYVDGFIRSRHAKLGFLSLLIGYYTIVAGEVRHS